MNKSEYVNYFNETQPLGCRKLSGSILLNYEKTKSGDILYLIDPNFREGILDYLRSIPEKEYFKLSEEKQKRNRVSSLLKNTIIDIQTFPIDQELNYRWEFLAYDLNAKQKYCWNKLKEHNDRDKNENQIYFNPSEMVDSFLSLDIKEFPISQEKKRKIINFLRNFGPYFIRYYSWESKSPKNVEAYFEAFFRDFINFKKAYELIKDKNPKRFPHAIVPPSVKNKLRMDDSREYEKWEKNINDTQFWFKMCLTEGRLPKIGKPPFDLELCGRGIGVACDYLYRECANLIQCPYPSCSKYFFKQQKNQTACCPRHARLVRIKKYKNRKKYKIQKV